MDQGMEGEEEGEGDEFGVIKLLPRSKSDGELLQRRFENDYDDMEDSDQVSLHDDGQDYPQVDHPGFSRVDYGMNSAGGGGYLKGINMHGGHMREQSEEEEVHYQEEEYPEEELVSEDYSEDVDISPSNSQKIFYGSTESAQVNKVPTINSVHIPTKNLLESQVVLNANSQLASEVINSGDLQYKSTPTVFQGEPSGKGRSQFFSPQASVVKSEPIKDLVVKEINNHSKSLVTVEDFGEDESKPLSSRNAVESPQSSGHHIRDQFIDELKGLRNIKDVKKGEEEEKENKNRGGGIKHLLTPSADTSSIPLGMQTPLGQTERILLQKTFEQTHHLQEELVKLREEQAKKWSEIMNQLDTLQAANSDTDFSSKAKEFIENLARQSELNKKMLIDNIEIQKIVRTQTGFSDERSLMADIDNLIKQHPSAFESLQVTTPYESAKKGTSEVSGTSAKKTDFTSPMDNKYPLKKRPFEFGKKTNLEIDINSANEDHDNGNGGLNLDLSHMRIALGSEQLIREQSARTITQGLSTPTEGDMIELGMPDNISLFERDPFKEFTHKKFKELMHQDNMHKIIQMREQALEIRHQTQMENMKKMLENRRFSPRTFQTKQIELEKWVTKEREILQKSKKRYRKRLV